MLNAVFCTIEEISLSTIYRFFLINKTVFGLESGRFSYFKTYSLTTVFRILNTRVYM